MVYNSVFSRSVGGGRGYVVQATAPEDQELLWINTAQSNVIYFYNPSSSAWEPVGSAWSAE